VITRTTFATTQCTSTGYQIFDGSEEHPQLEMMRSRPTAVVVDRRIVEHHSVKLRELTNGLTLLGMHPIAGGEQCKAADTLSQILTFLHHSAVPKHGLVIAVGGGTVCDITSVASQLYRRGVSLVLMPTTLLAQTDAAIGGKNGLNWGTAKNLVGGFYHPEAVLCDIAFLRTLNDLQATCGIAECIKVFAVSDDRALYRFFSRRPKNISALGEHLCELVALAAQRKLDLLAEDPFELSSRRLLNYGHAFAHSFEERSGFQLTHGEAVLVGMTIENMISKKLGIASDEIDEIQAIITSYFTPACRDFWIDADEVPMLLAELRAARRGSLNIVCIERCGKAVIVDDESDYTILAAWSDARSAVERALEVTAKMRSESAVANTARALGQLRVSDR
jgi:3-dehydroquinate synthetase